MGGLAGRVSRATVWVIACIVLTCACACALTGILVAEISLRLPHRAIADAGDFRQRIARQFGTQVQPVSLAAGDGANLKAWFIPAPRPNGRAVILLHGIGGNRVDVSGYGDIFLAQGYSVLLPDSRDHGESGGRVATFGLMESDDVRRWTAWVRTRAPECTFLLGESLGAAIALQAAAITPEICAVAVEDPYATFRQVAYERLGRETGLGTLFWRTAGAPIVEAAIHWAHWRYGVWLPDAAPELAVQRSVTPALLMTGTADRSIPMHHAEELQEACGRRCDLWIVPGAGHGGISSVTGAEFGRRLLQWFDRHDPDFTLPPNLQRLQEGQAIRTDHRYRFTSPTVQRPPSA